MKVFTGDIIIQGSDVLIYTGVNLDGFVLMDMTSQATAAIETVTGVFTRAIERETPVSVSDAAWIRRAIIYQAAWLATNGDAPSRTAVSHLAQDGVVVNAPNELTFVLAPLAKRALNNCSWAKNGTYRVAPATTSMSDVKLLANDNHQWDKMGGF